MRRKHAELNAAIDAIQRNPVSLAAAARNGDLKRMKARKACLKAMLDQIGALPEERAEPEAGDGVTDLEPYRRAREQQQAQRRAFMPNFGRMVTSGASSGV